MDERKFAGSLITCAVRSTGFRVDPNGGTNCSSNPRVREERGSTCNLRSNALSAHYDPRSSRC
jgi:hypothetical protein